MAGTTVKLRSIQGEQQKIILLKYLPCKAFRKHSLDGHVFEETIGGRKVWVARLECDVCGTHRIDVMKPKKCDLISRAYVHPDDYDTMLDPARARRILYRHMMDNGVSLASLAG